MTRRFLAALLLVPTLLGAQQTGYITVSDGARLFYKTSGKPGRGVDTIIAIHGGPGLDLGTIYRQPPRCAANRQQLDSTNTDSIARAGCREYWRIGMRPRLGEPDRTWPLMKADFCETDLQGIRYGSRFGTRTITNSFGDWDLRPALASLRVPLFVLHGEEETIPMDLIEEWVTAMPKGMATLIRVPRAAHFVYLERPDIVWPAVEKFLAKR